jgi:hypothetical protein
MSLIAGLQVLALVGDIIHINETIIKKCLQLIKEEGGWEG